MDVSVIVTSYNNSHNLAECIDALLRQKLGETIKLYEIIVVDSGSTDNSAEILESYAGKVRFITPPQPLQNPLSAPTARNLGAEHAHGEILIFTDSDCTGTNTWVFHMVQHYKDTSIGAVIGNREPDKGKGLGTFIRRYEFILYSNKFTTNGPLMMDTDSLSREGAFIPLAGNNFSMRAALWHDIGGMKNIFPGEDILLEIDILKRNGGILFDPNIVVSHYHPVSFRRLLRRSWSNGVATHRIALYSKRTINSRHFQKRGKNYNISLFLSIIIGIPALLIVSAIKSCFYSILLMLCMFVAFSFIYMTFGTYRELRCILRSKSINVFRQYKLSIFQAGAFVAAHFLVKFIASISIITSPGIIIWRKLYSRDYN